MELEERISALTIDEDEQEELIALASIFEGDLEIVESTNKEGNVVVNIQIHPSEGGVKLTDQELRVTLTIQIIYSTLGALRCEPVRPMISIRNCKGLSNKEVHLIRD